MKKNIFIKYLLLAGIASATVFSGCRKETAADKVGGQAANNGKTLVGFPTGMENTTFFDPFTNIKTIDVFSIKKDAKDNADLMKSNNFVVSLLPDAVDNYNENNDTEYELLPSSFYTIVTSTDLAISGNNYTFKFTNGDFQKTFSIKLDGSKLDLSKTYMLPYKLTNSDGVGIHDASKDTLYAIYSVKNKYDGVYILSGSIQRFVAGVADATLGGTYGDDVESNVATIAANANTFEIFWANGGGVGGIAGLQLAVDPTTNKVTVTASGNATLQNTPGEDNYYDSDAKTFHLAFDWGADANNKRIAKITLKYSASR
jgi:hypothetical protein